MVLYTKFALKVNIFDKLIATGQVLVMKEIEINNENRFSSCQQEMKLLKNITHPNIVKYVDSFTIESKFYIIMEHCEKGDLNDYLLRTGSQYPIAES